MAGESGCCGARPSQARGHCYLLGVLVLASSWPSVVERGVSVVNSLNNSYQVLSPGGRHHAGKHRLHCSFLLSHWEVDAFIISFLQVRELRFKVTQI